MIKAIQRVTGSQREREREREKERERINPVQEGCNAKLISCAFNAVKLNVNQSLMFCVWKI